MKTVDCDFKPTCLSISLKKSYHSLDSSNSPIEKSCIKAARRDNERHPVPPSPTRSAFPNG